MFDVNVLALSIVTRESVALMRSTNVDDGHIVNINSMSGHRVAHLAMYAGSKFAVTALTEGLRRELRAIKSHIRSTSISPGYVETEILYKYVCCIATLFDMLSAQVTDLSSNSICTNMLIWVLQPCLLFFLTSLLLPANHNVTVLLLLIPWLCFFHLIVLFMMLTVQKDTTVLLK